MNSIQSKGETLSQQLQQQQVVGNPSHRRRLAKGMKRAADSGSVDPSPAPYLRPHSRSSKNISDLAEAEAEVDILFAKKFGKKYLIRSNGEQVDVESSLEGKLIGLLFVNAQRRSHIPRMSYIFDTYNKLNEHKPSPGFEIVLVYVPPTHPIVTYKSIRPEEIVYGKYYNSTSFNKFVSSLPFLSIPFSDEAWRYFLCSLYTRPYYPLSYHLTIIDHSGNVLNKSALLSLQIYGHLLYPFTLQRQVQLDDHFNNLLKETNINALLASTSNGGYLINRHNEQVPISQLEGKHVALYAYNSNCPDSDSSAFLKQLVEIYNQFRHQGFEIVFINFHEQFGYRDKKSFDDALREMPWLALPFGDDSVWSLSHIFNHGPFLRCDDEWFEYPTLFIRAKGEALLDPYGYHVINKYGLQAYPFTRRAALRSDRRILKGLTLKSFIEEAKLLGLDFSTLIQNKNENGDVDLIPLSELNLRKRRRGILLLFANSNNFTEKALNGLIDSYTKQEPTSSFEVIYVSLDKDKDTFRSHFSGMPWFSFRRRLTRKMHKKLTERTIKFNFDNAYCIAFGHRGNFLRTGDLPTSFENRVFPFIEDVEFMNSLGMCMYSDYEWIWNFDRALGAEDSIDWLDD